MNIRKIQSKVYLSILLLLLPLLASAERVEINGIYYVPDSKTYQAKVTAPPKTRYAGEVIIPATVNYAGVDYSVTSIDANAFNYSGLTSITLPESMTSIGAYAFYDCRALTAINIPASVASIGTGAFANCPNLTTMTVDENNATFDSRGGCNAIIETSSNTLIVGSPATVIPEDVTGIGNAAFAYGSYPTAINIPASVTNIGDWAFYQCSGLATITLPEGLTNIGKEAFKECFSLTSITIPSSVTNIGSMAFSECMFESKNFINNSSCLDNENWEAKLYEKEYDGVFVCNDTAVASRPNLTTVTVPMGVTCIGQCAFYQCDSLTSVTIPASVTSIEGFAFYQCGSLASITLPEGLTSIGGNAFSGCGSLTAITIPASVTSIGNAAFSTCNSLTSIAIPASVTSIGDNMFSNCSSLTAITLPASVTSIGAYAFSSCPNLASITLPENLTSIGDNAFYFSKGLTSITIPANVTSIGNFAFYYCSNLAAINISASVTSIGLGAFSECPNLTSMTIAENNTTFDSRDGCNAIIETSSNTLVAGCATTVIPEGVTTIGARAFYGCSNLTAITLPEGVTTIRDHAFYNCASLTTITLPEDLTSIGEDAFQYCICLASITLPESLTSIGESAFDYCSSLTAITIPKSVTSIGSWAFRFCKNVSDVYCYADELPTTGSYLFDDSVLKNSTLHVPASALEAYKTTAPWSKFGTIVAMEEPKPYLVTEGKQWAICATAFCPPPNQLTITYRLQGDTIIEGKQYLIEHESNDIHLSDWKPSGRYMREENGKVYEITDSDKRDELVFDFSMQVGDTLYFDPGNVYDSGTCLRVVCIRDTVMPNGDGIVRRCYDIEDGLCDNGVYMFFDYCGLSCIEGIGYTHRGLSEPLIATTGGNSQLLYVKQDNTMLYQKEKGVYWIGNHVNWRPLTQHGYGLYHGMYDNTFLYAYTINEAAGVTDSTDFARWNDREVIRIDVDTIGPNAFSGATFRQGQIICFTERLNTIFKDAFTGINILPRSTQDASLADDLTLVFEGNRPPLIDKNQILDYADSTCRINYAVPDIATYVASDIQWTYTTLMTIEDLLRGYISPENEVTVSDSTEVNVVVDEEVLGPTGNGDLVVTVEARPRKDIPVRIGDGENKDIYSRAPAWQRYTMELKVTDSQETVLFEDAQECNAEEGCVFEVVLSAYPEDGVVYLHSRSVDMFNRSTEWSTRTASLTGIEQVEVLDQNAPYYDLQGRPVVNPTRGIYIKDGKKIAVD